MKPSVQVTVDDGPVTGPLAAAPGEHRKMVGVLEVRAPGEVAAADRGEEASRGGVRNSPVGVHLVSISGVGDEAVKGG